MLTLSCLLWPLLGGARNDRRAGATLSITRNAALIEVTPRYEVCLSTENDKAFTSSASAGIGSRFRRSSSHSVSWLGICSRCARLRSSSDVEAIGDWNSPCETGDVFEPVGDRCEGALWGPVRSSREMSSCRERGSSDCASRVGYNRWRTVRHSSRDWESASRVLSRRQQLPRHGRVELHTS